MPLSSDKQILSLALANYASFLASYRENYPDNKKNTAASDKLQPKSDLDGIGLKPFDPGRDPVKIGQIMQKTLRSLDSNHQLALQNLKTYWPNLVGGLLASQTEVEGITSDRQLIVRCRSRSAGFACRASVRDLLARLASLDCEFAIESVKFVAYEAKRAKFRPKRM